MASKLIFCPPRGIMSLMDKDAIPVFIVIGIIVLVGSFFFWQQSGNSRQPEVPATEELNFNSGDGSGAVQGESELPVSNPTAMAKTQDRQPPAMQIDTAKTYKAVLKTSEGDITIRFNDDQTPITVNNFISLAREGFYDGTIFHRVIDGFMIQGGDPLGTGTGSPGYRFDDEPFEGEYTRGTIAMANAGPNTNGSQFFIMHADYPLPPNYVIFGKVEEGMEVVDAIATSETEMSPMGEQSVPVDPAMIEAIEIIEE